MSTALEMAERQIAEYEKWAGWKDTICTPLPGHIREWRNPEDRYYYYGDLMLARWIVEQAK